LINIPAVITVHLPVGLYHGSLETHRARLGRRVYKKLDRWLNHQLSFTKKIIYVSENVYDSEIKSGQSDPYNSIVIRNGIDLEPFNRITRVEARSEFNLAQNTKIIIFIGRLDEQKGVDILVDAVRILNKNQDDFQVWLLGDGENRKNIEDQVRDSDLNGKVILWGFQENIPLYLMASDIFVLPSRYEGMSISLLNGLAAGLPCIVSGVGESDLIVKDGINGIVIPPNDVGSLVKALETLLSTDNLCKRLSESAKLSAADYTEDIMVEQIEQVYNECLEL
jgi:glycosyltransferase involved in cell wall biosynthesis